MDFTNAALHTLRETGEGRSVFLMLFNITGFLPNQATKMKHSFPSQEGFTCSPSCLHSFDPLVSLPAFDFPSLSFYPQALLTWPQMGDWDQKNTCRTLYVWSWQAFNTNAIKGLTLAWNICLPDSHQH